MNRREALKQLGTGSVLGLTGAVIVSTTSCAPTEAPAASPVQAAFDAWVRTNHRLADLQDTENALYREHRIRLESKPIAYVTSVGPMILYKEDMSKDVFGCITPAALQEGRSARMRRGTRADIDEANRTYRDDLASLSAAETAQDQRWIECGGHAANERALRAEGAEVEAFRALLSCEVQSLEDARLKATLILGDDYLTRSILAEDGDEIRIFLQSLAGGRA